MTSSPLKYPMRLEDFEQGMLEGLSRFNSVMDREINADELRHLQSMVERALDKHEGREPSEHFIRLFVELVTISEASRMSFDDYDRLNDDDLRSFLATCETFIDSFFHK